MMPYKPCKIQVKRWIKHYKPGNPFAVVFRSTLPEMQSKRIDETVKKHPALPPEIGQQGTRITG